MLDLTILETIKPKQYNVMFKDYPLPMAAKKDIEGYTTLIAHDNLYLKKITKLLIENNINISKIDDSNIEVLIDLENGNVIRYLKEKCNVDVKALNSKVLKVNMKYQNDRDLSVLNSILENYFTLNKTKPNTNSIEYINNIYNNMDNDYVDYLSEVNKKDIILLKEKKRLESILPFDDELSLNIANPYENEVSIKDIYKNDSLFSKIPFERLNKEQIETLCERYFRSVVKVRMNDLKNDLSTLYNVPFNIEYNNQFQSDLELYGITGNTPPSEANNTIDVSLYKDTKYSIIHGDKVHLNTDVLSQLMITVIHEHEHVVQRIGLVDENLKHAIDSFEVNYSNGSIEYMENYKNDPAEIDANLQSFERFISLAPNYGIKYPKLAIMNKVEMVNKKADENMNLYDNNKFSNYSEIRDYLSFKLQNSIELYTSLEQHNKTM